MRACKRTLSHVVCVCVWALIVIHQEEESSATASGQNLIEMIPFSQNLLLGGNHASRIPLRVPVGF